jgi:hypothetical protein
MVRGCGQPFLICRWIETLSEHDVFIMLFEVQH